MSFPPRFYYFIIILIVILLRSILVFEGTKNSPSMHKGPFVLAS